MRFGIVGLGSMGRRRVRDLKALGHEVMGFDLRSDRNQQSHELFDIKTVTDFDALIQYKPDALVISTPPDQHRKYYEKSFSLGLWFFSEANILVPPTQWFDEQEKRKGGKGFPSGTWRFHPLFGVLRQELQSVGMDSVNTVHHHYGGYLPQWHPWEDYQDFYAGQRRETSAAREMVPFELEGMCWVLGPLKAVCCIQSRCVNWKTDIDDTYLLQLEFESGLMGTLSVELHHVAPIRDFRVSGQEYCFNLNLLEPTLQKFDRKTGWWHDVGSSSELGAKKIDIEEVYQAEISAFVQALDQTGNYPKTWADDRHLSNALYAAEESWRRKEWVTLREADTMNHGRFENEIDG
jgi:predicted dehydrogenase